MQNKKQILITVSAIVIITIVSLVVVFRPTITIQKKYVNPPAMYLAMLSKNPMQEVPKVLEKDPSAVNAVLCREPDYFKTPLRIAVADGNEELTNYLLRKGADPRESLEYFKTWKGKVPLKFLEKILKDKEYLHAKIKIQTKKGYSKKLTCRIIDGDQIEKHVFLSNADIANAQPYSSPDCNKLYNVRLKLTPKGQAIVGRVTSDNIGKCFGFWINGKLIASPEIHISIYTGVIFIPVKVDLKEAEQLANGIMKGIQ